MCDEFEVDRKVLHKPVESMPAWVYTVIIKKKVGEPNRKKIQVNIIDVFLVFSVKLLSIILSFKKMKVVVLYLFLYSMLYTLLYIK